MPDDEVPWWADLEWLADMAAWESLIPEQDGDERGRGGSCEGGGAAPAVDLGIMEGEAEFGRGSCCPGRVPEEEDDEEREERRGGRSSGKATTGTGGSVGGR